MSAAMRVGGGDGPSTRILLDVERSPHPVSHSLRSYAPTHERALLVSDPSRGG